MLKQFITEKFGTLSVPQKKVAEYIVNNPKETSYLTAKELAAKVGVSETTVFRLCQKLNFSGFSDLQQMLISSIVEDKKGSHEDCSSEIEEIINETLIEFNQHKEQLTDSIIENAVKKLNSYENIYIMGYGPSYGIASEIYSALAMLRDNVFFLRDSLTDDNSFLKFGEENLYIAVSFKPYYAYTFKFSKMAKEMDSCLCVVSDSYTSQVALIGDYTFIIREDIYKGQNIYNTLLINAIIQVGQKKYIDLFPKSIEKYQEDMYKAAEVTKKFL